MESELDTPGATGVHPCAWCGSPVLGAFATEVEAIGEGERIDRFHETCVILREAGTLPKGI
jgi:hypothetical protein